MLVVKMEYIHGVDCLSDLPDGELKTFLREWFDEKTYVVGHTSGSTGKPKKIHLSKEDMRASARITNRFFGIDRGTVLLLCLSVSYIAGKMMVVRALEAGAELWVVTACSHPLQEVEWIVGRSVDLAAVVPMQVEVSLQEKKEAELFGKVRRLLVGGAPVSESLESRLSELTTVSYATYGMTETVSHIALRKIGYEKEYFALGNVRFDQDERGCLCIDAPHLLQRHFVTNDVVELLDERHFRWLGRWDHVIISGGLKFFPEVIEQKISNLFDGRFFIASQPDERLGERIVLVVEGLLPMGIDLLKEQLGKVLTSYEMPREFIVLPHFSETRTGKMLRKFD